MLVFKGFCVLCLFLFCAEVNLKSINYSRNNIQSEFPSENNFEENPIQTSEIDDDIFNDDEMDVVREDINNVGLHTENLAVDFLKQLMKHLRKHVSSLKNAELGYLGVTKKSPMSAKINITEVHKIENQDDTREDHLIDSFLSKLNSGNSSENLSTNLIEKNLILPEKTAHSKSEIKSNLVHKIKRRSIEKTNVILNHLNHTNQEKAKRKEHSKQTDAKKARFTLKDLAKSLEGKSMEDISEEIFNIFSKNDANTNDSEKNHRKNSARNPSEGVKFDFVPLSAPHKSTENSLEDITNYVLDKIENSVEDLIATIPKEVSDGGQISNSLSEFVNKAINDSSGADKSRNAYFQSEIKNLKSVTESTLQEIQEAIGKIVPQNISSCIDELVNEDTINFQQLSLQLIQALKKQMQNTTQPPIEKKTNKEHVAKLDNSMNNIINTSNETIDSISKDFYDFLIEFAKVSENTSLKNATKLFLKEARNKFGNIFNLNSAEEMIEDNPIFLMISATLKDLQEQFSANKNNITNTKNAKSKNPRKKRQAAEILRNPHPTHTPESIPKIHQKMRQVNFPEPRDHLKAVNSTIPTSLADHSNKTLKAAPRMNTDHGEKKIQSTTTTEKSVLDITEKIKNNTEKIRTADTENRYDSSFDKISNSNNLPPETKKCVQYEGEETVGSEHITALKREVEKLQNLVSILKQEERILEDINEKSKRLNNSLTEDTNREQLLKILERLSRGQNETNNRDLLIPPPKIDQRIGEDMWLPEMNVHRSDKSFQEQEVERIKFELKKAELTLNETIMALEREVVRDNLMEMELNDQKLEMNLLKSMLRVLLEKSFHGEFNKDQHGLDFNRAPSIAQIRNSNTIMGGNDGTSFIPENPTGIEMVTDNINRGQNGIMPNQEFNLVNAAAGPILDNSNIVGKPRNKLFPMQKTSPIFKEATPITPVTMMNRNNFVGKASRTNTSPIRNINIRNQVDPALKTRSNTAVNLERRESNIEKNDARPRSSGSTPLQNLLDRAINGKSTNSDSEISSEMKTLLEMERRIAEAKEKEELKKELGNLAEMITRLENKSQVKSLDHSNNDKELEDLRKILKNKQQPESKSDDSFLNDELKNLEDAIKNLRPRDNFDDTHADNNKEREINVMLDTFFSNQAPHRQVPVSKVQIHTKPPPTQQQIPNIIYGPPRVSVRRPLVAPVKIVPSPLYEYPESNYQYDNLLAKNKLICTLESEPSVTSNSANSYGTSSEYSSIFPPFKNQGSGPSANSLSYELVPPQFSQNIPFKSQVAIPGPSVNRLPYEAITPAFSQSIPYSNQANGPSTKLVYEAPRISPPVYYHNVPQRNRVFNKPISTSYYQPNHYGFPPYSNNAKAGISYPAQFEKHQSPLNGGVLYSNKKAPIPNNVHDYHSSVRPQSTEQVLPHSSDLKGVVSYNPVPNSNKNHGYQNPAISQPLPVQNLPEIIINKNTQDNNYGNNFFPVQANTQTEEPYQPTYTTTAKTGPENLSGYGDNYAENSAIPQHDEAEISNLKAEIYNLQNTINSFNNEKYIQKPEVAVTVNKLQQEINDVKNMIHNFNDNGEYNAQQNILSPYQTSGYSTEPLQNSAPAYTSRQSRQKREAVLDNDFFPQFTGGVNNIETGPYSNTPAASDAIGSHLQVVKNRVAELRHQLDHHLAQPSEIAYSGTRAASAAPYDPFHVQQYPVPSYPMEVKSANYIEKTDWFTDIVEKIMDKLIAALPVVFRKLLNFFIGQFTSNVGYYGDGYGDQYSNELQNIFKNLGIFGIVPAIILNLLQAFSAFVNILKKNKFLKNFLIPALIIGIVAGSMIFLIWWLQPEDVDNYSYIGSDYGSNYGKNYDNSVSTATDTGYSNSQGYQKLSNENLDNSNNNVYRKVNLVPANSVNYR